MKTRQTLAQRLALAIEQTNRRRDEAIARAQALGIPPEAPAVQTLPDGSALVYRITELGQTRDLDHQIRVF